MAKTETAPEVEQPEAESALGELVAADVDGDGTLELDPAKVHQTLVDLVTLDHALRDEGSSVADLLRHIAGSVRGIRITA